MGKPHDVAASTKAAEEKNAERSTKGCHSNDDETDYAVQRFSMLFEHRRPNRLRLNNNRCDTHGYTAHTRNEDPVSPSCINHAARRVALMASRKYITKKSCERGGGGGPSKKRDYAACNCPDRLYLNSARLSCSTAGLPAIF